MRKVEYWVAEDGEEFDTEKECYEYEHKYDALAGKIILFENERTPLHRTSMLDYDIQKASAMYIPNDETALELMEFMTELGTEHPWDRFNGLDVEAGYYYYENSEWHNAERELENAERKLNTLQRAKMRAREF